ncbi:GNAT family N-acetyltransferase [Neiella sp. HB171785]|uniref:GNAT family N-acetyltransferase n=1 Tax=Neiella litorisoli TaxID=2771431 RepID=A0A8J6QSX1_9GAMM|nr:GNAT family N-acetyltransferase [Neiella litorisoli]MBD1390244.1 GNAT family N-acetyltransferase [Neiella litorisoli]
MIEQNSLYRDLDGLDNQCWHYVLEDERQPIAYARLIPPYGDHQVVHLGRLVIHKDYRGQGLGRDIMVDLLAECDALFPQLDVAISAQAHLREFYRSLGFECVGEMYDDGGIDHVDMVKTAA